MRHVVKSEWEAITVTALFSKASLRVLLPAVTHRDLGTVFRTYQQPPLNALLANPCRKTRKLPNKRLLPRFLIMGKSGGKTKCDEGETRTHAGFSTRYRELWK